MRSELNRGWALGRSGIYYTAPDAEPGASAIFLYDPERNKHLMLFPLREDEGGKLTTLPEVRLTDTPLSD